MSIKRRLASARIKHRHISEKRVVKQERKLMLERNKALKDADAAAKRAKLIEDKRQAQAKLIAAEERLRIAQGKGRKSKRGSALKSGLSALRSIRGTMSKLREMDRRMASPPKKRKK